MQLDNYLSRGHLPTFIIIGTMKGGTSSLHEYLKAHPQVCMSKKKETDYFLGKEYHGHNLSWYKKQFLCEADQYGESSPNYTKRHLYPDVAKRMHQLLPNVKLIYLVRDPIERAISNFMHALHAGRRTMKDFDAFFDQPQDVVRGTSEYYYHLKSADYYYLNTSNYYYQIQAYLEYYPLEGILIIASEDLRDRRRETLRKVFKFLEIDSDFDSKEFNKLSHVTTTKFNDKSSEVKQTPRKPQLRPEQLEKASAYIKPEIDQFRKLIGQEFSHWQV